jgi:hypothetical protein
MNKRKMEDTVEDLIELYRKTTFFPLEGKGPLVAAALLAEEIRHLREQVRDLTEVIATAHGVARPTKPRS